MYPWGYVPPSFRPAEQVGGDDDATAPALTKLHEKCATLQAQFDGVVKENRELKLLRASLTLGRDHATAQYAKLRKEHELLREQYAHKLKETVDRLKESDSKKAFWKRQAEAESTKVDEAETKKGRQVKEVEAKAMYWKRQAEAAVMLADQLRTEKEARRRVEDLQQKEASRKARADVARRNEEAAQKDRADAAERQHRAEEAKARARERDRETREQQVRERRERKHEEERAQQQAYERSMRQKQESAEREVREKRAQEEAALAAQQAAAGDDGVRAHARTHPHTD